MSSVIDKLWLYVGHITPYIRLSPLPHWVHVYYLLTHMVSEGEVRWGQENGGILQLSLHWLTHWPVGDVAILKV